jgi:hypothetical protein
VLAHQDDVPVTVSPVLSSGELTRLDGSTVDTVALEPFGVAVLLRT